MRRAIGVALGLGLTAIACPTAGVGQAVPSSADRCLQRGTTLDANRYVRLFRVGHFGANVDYVCWLRTHRVRVLGENNLNEEGITSPTIAGRYVAYDVFLCNDGACSGRVEVRNVSTGRVTTLTRGELGVIGRIVLRSTGTVAWSRVDRSGRTIAAAHGRTVRDVAAGGDIDVTSLALVGTRIYWMQGGTPRTALIE